jgi:hypothetical protein
MWFLVDMLAPQVFFSVELRAAPMSVDFPLLLRVSASVDGTTFTELRTQITGAADLKVPFATVQYARYLKLEALQAGTMWWSIADLYVRQ